MTAPDWSWNDGLCPVCNQPPGDHPLIGNRCATAPWPFATIERWRATHPVPDTISIATHGEEKPIAEFPLPPGFDDLMERATVDWPKDPGQVAGDPYGTPGWDTLGKHNHGCAVGMSRPTPVNGVVWEYRSPADGGIVYVRYEAGRWFNAPTPAGRWEVDDRIPEWPGTFAPLITRGAALGRFYPPLAYTDETHVHTDDDLARLTRPGIGMRADDSALFRRGSPKTPEAAAAAFDAITNEARRRHDADVRQREAEIRAELKLRISTALIGEYNRQHEGHQITAQARDYEPYDGVDMDKMAEAAVDAVADFYREGRQAMGER